MYARIKILYWIACWSFLIVFYRWMMPNWKVNLSVASVNIILFILLSETSLHYKLIPHYLRKNKYRGFMWLAAGAILFNGSLTLWATWSIIQRYSQSQYHDLFWAWENLIYGNYFVLAAFVAFSVCIKLIYDWLAVQKRIDQLEKEKVHAELSFLRSQLNPHFLFNSINSIYGHIDKNNTVAKTLLVRFAEIFRYQLYDCTSDIIPIDKEIAYMKNFVELQKIRKNNELQITLEVEENLTGMNIAPLLFIPFVENAFKYVSNRKNGRDYIYLNISTHENSLHFTCINSWDGLSNDVMNHRGIGIDNVARRLQLLYPGSHHLNIEKNIETFKVSLHIPFRTSVNPAYN